MRSAPFSISGLPAACVPGQQGLVINPDRTKLDDFVWRPRRLSPRLSRSCRAGLDGNEYEGGNSPHARGEADSRQCNLLGLVRFLSSSAVSERLERTAISSMGAEIWRPTRQPGLVIYDVAARDGDTRGVPDSMMAFCRLCASQIEHMKSGFKFIDKLQEWMDLL